MYDVCRAKRICQSALLITKEENVMSKLLKSIVIVSVFSMLFALLAALLTGCTPAAQPLDEESGVTTTTVSSDAPTAPTTTEVTVALFSVRLIA